MADKLLAAVPDPGREVIYWIHIIRRAWLDPSCKLVAFALASYASPDGTSIFPGTARLAVDCRLSYATVKRHMGRLRLTGLIAPGSRKGLPRRFATPYRLTFPGEQPGQLALDLHIMTPDEYDAAVDTLRAAQHRIEARSDCGSPVSRIHDVYGSYAAQNAAQGGASDLQLLSPPIHSTNHENQPSIDPVVSVSTPTGGRQPAAAEFKIDNQPDYGAALDRFDVTTRSGTSRAQRAQADALTEWQRNKPEAAS